jgi:hypothetical protein
LADVEIWCNCGRVLKVKSEYIGRRTFCPDCGSDWVIPDHEAALRAQLKLPPDVPVTRKISGLAAACVVSGMLSFCIPIVASLVAVIVGALALSEIRRSRGRLQGHTLVVMGIGTAILSALFWSVMLLAMNRGLNPQTFQQNACLGNLSQIGAAMRRYHESRKHFPPPAIVDKDGKPLLSWRVDLLREIDPGLYSRFHLDQPWDSVHNIALVREMPRIYACPSYPRGRAGMTHYQVVVGPSKPGPSTAFEDSRGISVDEFTDGLSSTLLVTEAASPVPWTKPEDLRYHPAPWMPPPNTDERDYTKEGPPPKFGNRHSRTFNYLRADGAVANVGRPNGRSDRIRALLTRDGRENIGGG